MALPREYVSGETHFYLGRRHKLIVHETNSQHSEVKLFRGKLEITLPEADRAAVRPRLNGWYEARAEEYLHNKFAEIADRLNWIKVRPPLKLMRMKTPWGSCSPGGMIYMNPALIRAPRHCIKYFILHELCHLAEHNHSKRFFDLLTRQMPDWETAKRELNSLSELILTGNE